jgi:hypothetical protein
LTIMRRDWVLDLNQKGRKRHLLRQARPTAGKDYGYSMIRKSERAAWRTSTMYLTRRSEEVRPAFVFRWSGWCYILSTCL